MTTGNWQVYRPKGSEHSWYFRADGLCFSLRPPNVILLAQMDEDYNPYHPPSDILEALCHHPRWWLPSAKMVIRVWPEGKTVADCVKALKQFTDLGKTCWCIPDVPDGVDPKDVLTRCDEYIPQLKRLPRIETISRVLEV